MWKKILLLTVLVSGFVLVGSSEANAARWRRRAVYRRPVVVAPVQRVVHRAVYPVVRAVPVVRQVVPVVRPYAYPAYYGPSYYGPSYYGPGVSVQIGF